MPSGIRHEELRQRGRLIAFPLSVIVPFFLSPINMRNGGEIIIGAGIFIGYEVIGKYCTPDWDLAGITNDESRMIGKLPILGNILFGISSMYGSFFYRHHRSFWTHFPFVSTSIRYLFLFWWIWYQIYISVLDWYWLIFLFMGMFVGTSFSDAIHWWADLTSNKED